MHTYIYTVVTKATLKDNEIHQNCLKLKTTKSFDLLENKAQTFRSTGPALDTCMQVQTSSLYFIIQYSTVFFNPERKVNNIFGILR